MVMVGFEEVRVALPRARSGCQRVSIPQPRHFAHICVVQSMNSLSQCFGGRLGRVIYVHLAASHSQVNHNDGNCGRSMQQLHFEGIKNCITIGFKKTSSTFSTVRTVLLYNQLFLAIIAKLFNARFYFPPFTPRNLLLLVFHVLPFFSHIKSLLHHDFASLVLSMIPCH
jgi:hypothetical protein